MEVLTVSCLSSAISNSREYTHMSSDESDALSRHIMNFFGFSDRIIDNVLQPEDRDTFYMLEDSGLMQTGREETTLYDGREWRIHYWTIRLSEIFKRSEPLEDTSEESSDSSIIYEEIPEDIWSR